MAAAAEPLWELVQWDTSTHDWLEGRGEQICLISMIDDAPRRPFARFVRHDTSEENMRLLWAYLERFGRPLAFYTDKAGMFQAPSPHPERKGRCQLRMPACRRRTERVSWSATEALSRRRGPVSIASRGVAAVGLPTIYRIVTVRKRPALCRLRSRAFLIYIAYVTLPEQVAAAFGAGCR